MKPQARIALLILVLLACAGSARAQSEPGEMYNPYLAEKNVEVGTFYLKKKNYDAAIERLLDALRYKPNHAKAHRLLAEAYDKKKNRVKAVEYYTKYLEIVPSADDADKVRKRITKLKKEIEKEKARRRRRSG